MAAEVELLGAKFSTEFTPEAATFRQQHPDMRIDMRRSRDVHGQSIVIDNTACGHAGRSVKVATKARSERGQRLNNSLEKRASRSCGVRSSGVISVRP